MTPKVGQFVHVEFWDHVWHSDDAEPGLAKTVACGVVETVTKEYIHIVSWSVADADTMGKEACSIARSCITKIRRLK